MTTENNFQSAVDAVSSALATGDLPVEAITMLAITENAKNRVYEPLRLIVEDQTGGACKAAVLIGIADPDDGFCFIQCVPKEHRKEMASRLRERAFQLENQDD